MTPSLKLHPPLVTTHGQAGLEILEVVGPTDQCFIWFDLEPALLMRSRLVRLMSSLVSSNSTSSFFIRSSAMSTISTALTLGNKELKS